MLGISSAAVCLHSELLGIVLFRYIYIPFFHLLTFYLQLVNSLYDRFSSLHQLGVLYTIHDIISKSSNHYLGSDSSTITELNKFNLLSHNRNFHIPT